LGVNYEEKTKKHKSKNKSKKQNHLTRAKSSERCPRCDAGHPEIGNLPHKITTNSKSIPRSLTTSTPRSLTELINLRSLTELITPRSLTELITPRSLTELITPRSLTELITPRSHDK
jgi:hypothetical protein